MYSTVRKIYFIIVLFLLGAAAGESVLRAQCPMVCRQDFTVSLGADGEAELTADVALSSNPAGCTAGFTVEIIHVVSGYNYGSTATEYMIGEDLYFKVTDNATGNNCTGNIAVVDNTPPQIFLDTLFLDCNAPTDPEIIGFPEVQDNVSQADELTFDWIDEFTDRDCDFNLNGIYYTAEISRTWYVADAFNNIRSEEQILLLRRNTLADIEWPANRDDFAAPSLSCHEDDPTDLTLTGEPSINGHPLSAGGDCDLLTSHFDQTTTICGGETKVFRNWTVFDYCTDESTNYIQLIRVKDTQAPVITCPPHLNVGTQNGLCTAVITPQNATATDNCSDYTISHTWEFGEGQTTYEDIPQGTHTLTYEARDACGNESTCHIEVTVTDGEVPTPVCKEHTFVSLGDTGPTTLGAHTFNENSTDNCQISHYAIAKSDGAFMPSVTFDCADVPASPMLLTLRVFDTAGSYNECEVTVTVDDYLAPVLTCPLPAETDCADDYTDLTLTGTAAATDNCTVADVGYLDDLSDLNACGLGTVLRLWSAEDTGGNLSVCVQQITVGDATPTEVTFPADFITDDCGLKPTPETAGMPLIDNTDCEQMLVFYADDTVSVTDACLHIERLWEVYDDCLFDPNENATAGYWSHYQTLQVYDNDAPELTVPADITVFIEGEDCEAWVAFADAWATDCSQAIEVSNNAPYAEYNEQNASGFYPAGYHYITFTARDECNNISNKSVQLTVIDAEIPTILCNGGFTVNLGTDGTTTVNPQLFDAGSYDNCSATLTYHLTPQEFNCSHRGETEVLFQVRDEAGNEASCFTTLVVQDNSNYCAQATLGGKISNEEGENIGGIYVGLSGGVPMAVPTQADGTFEFSDLPAGEYYEIKPTYDLYPVNGVTTNDILLMRQHILGLQTLDSPYKLLAADINNSGNVSTVDLLWLRKLILGIIEDFPDNKSRRFIPADYTFPDPANPWQEEFPEEIIIPALNQNYLANDFIAVKIGDVNGTANLINAEGEGRDFFEGERLTLSVENRKLTAGQEYEISFKNNENFSLVGMQVGLVFSYNDLKFSEISCDVLPRVDEHNFGLNHAAKGEINFVWDDTSPTQLSENQTLFTLRFTALTDCALSDVLQLNTQKIAPEAYRREEKKFIPVRIDLEFAETAPTVQLLQNYPNPTTGRTSVEMIVPTAQNVRFEVFDTNGKIVFRKEEFYPPGRHRVDLDLRGRPGLYFYAAEGENFPREVWKMIIAAEE